MASHTSGKTYFFPVWVKALEAVTLNPITCAGGDGKLSKLSNNIYQYIYQYLYSKTTSICTKITRLIIYKRNVPRQLRE